MFKKIALYGIGGLYNYGCEAIVRGAVENIRRINKNCDITYYSKCYEYDKNQIKDLNINIVNIESKSNIIKKVIDKSIDILKIPIIPFNKKEYIDIIDNNDIIMSIGGDIYSIPKYKRDKRKYQYVNKMVEFGEMAKLKGKKVIIYGASIGPFGEYLKAKSYFIEHLKKLDLIVCREKYSIDYLKSNGVRDNVIFLPDPAYLVGSEMNLEKKQQYIGINLSSLSLHELYGKVDSVSIGKICGLIKKINSKLNLPIMLIPHVYSPFDELDNDYKFMKKIYDNLDEKFKESVRLVKPNGFLDAKNYLKECKVVIAARMHCGVNAIIESVPTIFLSYSIKSKGMAEFIYGDLKWFLPLNRMENELIDLIRNIYKDGDKINKNLINRKQEIDKYFNNTNINYNRLKKIILDKRD